MSKGDVHTQTVTETLFLALNHAWREYHECLRACRKNPKTKPVHEIRIALRRLVVLLELVDTLFKSKGARKLRKELKKEMHCVRDLRDYQNQEKDFEKILRRTELPDFRRDLRKKRKQEEKRIRSYFKSIPRKKTDLALHAEGEALLANGTTPAQAKRAKQALQSHILARYRAFQTAAKRAKADDLASIHRARIEFKKLRYLEEELSAIFPLPASRRAALKRVHKLLGDIQDFTVGLRLLSEFLISCRKAPPDAELQRVQRLLEKKQEEQIAQFLPNRTRLLAQLRPVRQAA